VVKVRLVDHAVGCGDLAASGDAGSKHRGTLELRFDIGRVDRYAGVHRGIDARNPNAAFLGHFNFYD